MTTGLEVSGLTVRYGGNTAVDSVSFTAHRSAVTGLIGPNGAGKTSTFNAVSGILRPASGTVALDGEDITTLSVQARAQRGLGRTFQRMQLFERMSVYDNIALGLEARRAAGNPLRHFVPRRNDGADVRRSALEAVELCGLTHLVDRTVAGLSTGQRRLVDLARVVAGGFSFLLLDEPSSGLDNAETEEFGDIVYALVQDKGCGVLLVEHDMALVMRICARLFVLDFGKQLFDGTPEQTRRSDVVRQAYLGTEVA